MATTARGFEPLRAEPNGFLVHHLSHSVTLSWTWMDDLPAGLSATANVATQGSMGGGLPVSRCGLSAPAEHPQHRATNKAQQQLTILGHWSPHARTARGPSRTASGIGAALPRQHCVSRVGSTARGFEPLRAEPNGFRVHPLGSSGTVSRKHTAMVIVSIAQRHEPRASTPSPEGT